MNEFVRTCLETLMGPSVEKINLEFLTVQGEDGAIAVTKSGMCVYHVSFSDTMCADN